MTQKSHLSNAGYKNRLLRAGPRLLNYIVVGMGAKLERVTSLWIGRDAVVPGTVGAGEGFVGCLAIAQRYTQRPANSSTSVSHFGVRTLACHFVGYIGLHIYLKRLRRLIVIPGPKYHILQKLGRVAEMHQRIHSTTPSEEFLSPKWILLTIIRIIRLVGRICPVHIADKRIRDIGRRKGNVVLRGTTNQKFVVVGRTDKHGANGEPCII